MKVLRSMLVALFMFLASQATGLCAQSGTLTIDTTSVDKHIPSTLFGVFFEEINMAGEGGLYGELIQNRSFANSSEPDAWTLLLDGTPGWLVNSGNWSIDTTVTPRALAQSSNAQDCRAVYLAPGSSDWSDYTLRLQARKLGGSEGFLIMFHAADADNWLWWNIGGWDNTQHAIEGCVNGSKSTLASVPGSIAADRWYDIRIEIAGAQVSCFLDDVLIQSYTMAAPATGGVGLSTWATQAEFRNIVVTGPASQILYQSDFEGTDGIAGEMSVDNGMPLNATNLESLRLTMNSATGSVSVANSGFWGIPLTAGEPYNFQLHTIAGDGFSGLLTVRLESADGETVYAEHVFHGITTDWQKLTATLTPDASDTNARLVLTIDTPGTVWLDVVSLFPEATFKNRPNGMRRDLANAVADLSPAFLRFPGGCYVEGHYLADAFDWKKSIGDISERPGHPAYWDYYSSDGLGYHEYLQLCEDIGAEPLFCINVGMSHNEVAPMAEMGRYVQDALDALEYANGDATTTWGAKRATNGHPEPFGLKYIQIGNENGGSDYNERYALLYDAIRSAWPDVHIVACVWGGTPTSRPFDLMDEHYYTNATTMASFSTKYDNYDRNGPKVFVGEYAVTSGAGTYGNLSAAVAEAAFMTGIERNCDVVSMASYAPLFANLHKITWRPDAIYFDNSSWFGTPAYHVQKIFANNLGDVVLPMNQDFARAFGGSIGLSTWETDAEYRNIVVTSSTGDILYQSNFESNTAGWMPTSGTWSVNRTPNPDAYRQTSSTQDARTTYSAVGSADWRNYTLSLQARKRSGNEGFLIMFYVSDSNNWFWWNLGGWNNTQHAIEYAIDGSKSTGPRVGGLINTNQWYDIRIEIEGGLVRCYLDNVLTHTFTFPSAVHSVASLKQVTREIILKSVNPSSETITADIVLDGVTSIAPTAKRILLTSNDPADENTPEAPQNVVPVTDWINTPSTRFPLELPPHSVTILRVQTPPGGIGEFEATPADGEVLLTWTGADGATSYSVLRSGTPDDAYTVIASGLTDGRYIDTTVISGSTYSYLISAVNSAGETTTNTAASVTTQQPAKLLAVPKIRIEGNHVHVSVQPTVAGRIYTLECCSDPANPDWQIVGEPKTGTGEEVEFVDEFDGAIPACFYRVVISTG